MKSRFCIVVLLKRKRKTYATREIPFYFYNDFEITNIDLYKGKKGKEVFIKELKVKNK